MRSPNYPDPYPAGQVCANLIRFSSSSVVQLTFLDFGLSGKQGGDWWVSKHSIQNSSVNLLTLKHVWKCFSWALFVFIFSWDTNLGVYEGKYSSFGTRLTKEICGSSIPAPIYSKTNEMFIRFQSYDNVDNHKGYKLLVEEKGMHWYLRENR